MFKILQGRRPDITAAQIAAVLVAGVPAIATLLTAFGLGDLSTAQQDALVRRAHLVGDPRRPADRRRRHPARRAQPRRSPRPTPRP